MNTNLKKTSSLFSEETLNTISMAVICGGEDVNNCQGGNCGDNCGCTVVTANTSVYISSCKMTLAQQK